MQQLVDRLPLLICLVKIHVATFFVFWSGSVKNINNALSLSINAFIGQNQYVDENDFLGTGIKQNKSQM